MVCWHRTYNTLGDEQPKGDPGDWLREFAGGLVDADDPDLIPAEHVQRILDKHVVMLPLYLFDHSGLAMSTSSEHFRMFDAQGWDWGQVGWIYCTLEKAREEFTSAGEGELRDRIARCLVEEVEQYHQYLSGDVWSYCIEQGEMCDKGCLHWEVIDSCGGFYGSDPEENGMMEQAGEYGRLLVRAYENDGRYMTGEEE